ncbi:hypothetical protein Gotur_026389 [Gossypium turneri]
MLVLILSALIISLKMLIHYQNGFMRKIIYC